MDFYWLPDINLILAIQKFGDWLIHPMEFLTSLGNEEFYLIIMPFFFWCVDTGSGFRIGLMLLLSNGFNAFFKVILNTPRPYWIDTRVVARITETSFGMPSGHAMQAASIWGLLASLIRKRWVTYGIGVIILLIGFSRIYLGVHFISDVLLGWIIGFLLLALFIHIQAPIINWLKKLNVKQLLLLSIGTSVVLLVLAALPPLLMKDRPIPQLWLDNSSLVQPDDPIKPFSVEGAFTVAGTWLGITAGYTWLIKQLGGMNTTGSTAKKFIRYIIGMIGVFVIWYGLGAIFPRDESISSYLLRFIRYSILGGWVAAVAPWLFIRLKLAHSMHGIMTLKESDQ